MKVYLSPSTQDKNVGYGDYGTEEQRMNQLAVLVSDLLIYNGFTVVKNKPEMTLAQVVADSNAQAPDIHVALHSNAMGTGVNTTARGCEVFAYMVDGKITNSQKLATFVYNELSAITPTADKGVQNGALTKFAEIISVKATSILIEHAFHDNPEDEAWLVNSMWAIAEADVKGICEYAGITYRKTAPTVDYKALYESIKTLYDGLTVKYTALKKQLLILGGD